MSRCFVHLTNSLAWRAITGEPPPTIPPTAKQYAQAGVAYYAGSAGQSAKSIHARGNLLGMATRPTED